MKGQVLDGQEETRTSLRNSRRQMYILPAPGTLYFRWRGKTVSMRTVWSARTKQAVY